MDKVLSDCTSSKNSAVFYIVGSGVDGGSIEITPQFNSVCFAISPQNSSWGYITGATNYVQTPVAANETVKYTQSSMNNYCTPIFVILGGKSGDAINVKISMSGVDGATLYKSIDGESPVILSSQSGNTSWSYNSTIYIP